MDFATLKDHFIDYIMQEFKHDLLDDKVDNPFVQISVISTSAINPHRDSFGMYAVKQGNIASHLEYSTVNMSRTLVLEAEYLLQKRPVDFAIEEEFGYIKGHPIKNKQILLVSAVSNLEDARFVCKSVFNKLITYLK